MRPLFYDFPQDEQAWADESAYMFGEKILVAPVMERGLKSKKVYLPEGSTWTNVWTRETINGGQTVKVETPLDQIPLFTRDGFELGI